MKTMLAALLLTAAGVADACTTQTYFIDGRMVVCTVCCTNGNCMTTCF